ncbi:MAG: helicase-associated domain-containing protein [Anaerolineales bacterium]|jgi:hypothetical protein
MDLIHVLEGQDSGFWRILARAWEIPQILNSRDQLPDVVRAMLEPDRVDAKYRGLSPEDRAGVDRLRALGGKMPLARFSSEFGEVREMGIARRERDQPWLNPVSAAERLWYQGWLGRTFLDSSNGPEEFVFIPDDLLRLIPFPAAQTVSGLPVETYVPRRGEREARAGLASVWDACTLMAFLRNYPPRASEELSRWPNRHVLDRHLQLPETAELIFAVLAEGGWIGGDPLQPVPARCREFLELEPQAALERIIQGWEESRSWNDLAHVAGIALGAKAWPNDALRTRLNFIEILRDLPQGEWILVDSLIKTIQEQRPDFQRPLPAFSSWYLLDPSTGEPLAGPEKWPQVEGALIHFYLEGPLHWLGAVDLLPGENPRAFRLTASAASLWQTEDREASRRQRSKKNSKAPRPRIRPEGTIVFPAAGSALRRYQLSRCATWVTRRGGDYVYRLTPNALQRAREQGIEGSHVIALLSRLAEGEVPPQLVQAITRWGRSGAEASIRSLRVLDLSRLGTETPLWDLPAVKDCLGEAIGPRTWVVRRDRVPQLRTALLEHGVLVELEDEE